MKTFTFIFTLLLAAQAASAATINWAAGIDHGFSTSTGTNLATGSLVRLGWFRDPGTGVQLSDTQIQSYASSAVTLNTYFVEVASTTIGTGYNPAIAGHFSATSNADTGSAGLNLSGRQIYLWVFNAATLNSATEHAVLYWSITDSTTNPDAGTAPGSRWSFPVQEPVPGATTIDLTDLTTGTSALAAGARVVVGTFPTGTSSTTSSSNFGLTPVQTPLAVATISPLPGASLDSAYTTTLLSTGGTAGYSWDVSSGVLPNGITLASNGTFSGIPTATGSFTFTVRVTDSVPDTATCSVTLHVSTTAVAVTTSSLPDGTAGIAYNQSLSASGGEGSYVWSLTSGTLQSGLSLSSAGVISGTPIVAATRSITVKVTDSGNRSASAVLSLTTTPSPLNITTSYLNKAVSNVAYTASFAASGGTVPYTLSLQSGTLPSGLSFANGVISGKTSVLGSTNLSVLVTDGLGVTATKAFTLTVINKAVAPIMDTPVFPTLMISTLFSHQLTAKEFPKTFTATGLPKGLVIAATTGLITGRPTVSGVYNVLVNAANTGGTSPTVTVKLIVQALPNNAVGTFVGHIARNSTVNGSLGGRVDLTTTSTGTYTLKLTQGGKVTSLKGNLTTSANSTPAVSITSASISVALSLPNDTITGDVTVSTSPAAVVGWRRVWNTTLNPAVKQVGYYTTGIDLTTDVGVDTIPQGTGYASFSIGLDGGLTVSGKTSDGSSITSAGFMGPNGEILVHQVLYTNLGSLLGQLNLTTDTNGDFTENSLAGSLTWKKPAIATSRTYPNSFDLILGVAGKYISASSSSGIVLGLPEVNTNATLEFAEGGIGSSALNPNVSFTLSDVYKPILPTAGGFDNPAKTTLILTTKNGVISGAASLVDGAVKRALTYQGLIVRGADASTKAYGYFLLPQIPTSGQTATTAPILSGQVTINQ